MYHVRQGLQSAYNAIPFLLTVAVYCSQVFTVSHYYLVKLKTTVSTKASHVFKLLNRITLYFNSKVHAAKVLNKLMQGNKPMPQKETLQTMQQ